MNAFSSILLVVSLVIFEFSRFEGVTECVALSIDLSNITLNNSYDPEREYDYPTDWPINIDTSLSKLVITTPASYTTGPLAKLAILNDGKTVILQNEQKPQALDSIGGGPLGNNTFIYEYGRFYWVNDTKGRAASTLNNQSFPLEFALYHWNTKYGSLSNAVNYRDGVAVLDFIFIVADLPPNPTFEPLSLYLKKITQAGAEEHTIVGPISLFLVPYAPEYFYVYPGSYTDEDTGKTYYCAQYLFQPLPVIISTSQFQDFLNLRDFNGKPLTNQAPLFPYRGQPIVTGVGGTVEAFL